MGAGKYLDTVDHLPKKSVILGAHPLRRKGCFGNLPGSEGCSPLADCGAG